MLDILKDLFWALWAQQKCVLGHMRVLKFTLHCSSFIQTVIFFSIALKIIIKASINVAFHVYALEIDRTPHKHTTTHTDHHIKISSERNMQTVRQYPKPLLLLRYAFQKWFGGPCPNYVCPSPHFPSRDGTFVFDFGPPPTYWNLGHTKSNFGWIAKDLTWSKTINEG